MEEKIRVMIVDDIQETRNNISALLQFNNKIEIVGEAENGEEALINIAKLQPDIVLMDINMPVKDGIKATEEVSISYPDTAVIIISVQGEQEYLRKAMAAGARDFICKPFSGDDLLNTIIKTYNLEQKRKENTFPKLQEEIKSKVITLFSTKGGVGKTTLASNIAVAIAKETKNKVALIDLDLQFGNIAVFLNIPIKGTIVDLVRETNEFDCKLVEDYLCSHYSGVKVLLAPVKPEYSEFITGAHVEKIINCLKETYNYIIIDTQNNLNEVTLSALDLSDKVLFVTGMDLPSIKNTKQGLEIMESLNYSKNKLSIVVNRANEQYGIKIKDIENTTKFPVWAVVPEDEQTITISINKGFPFVLTRSETKVAKSVLEIVEGLTKKVEKKVGEQKSLIKLLFK